MVIIFGAISQRILKGLKMRASRILKSIITVVAFIFAGMSQAEVLKIDAAKSTIEWHGAKVLKADKHDGNIKVKSGKVEFKKNVPVSANIVVDMKSITDNDLEDPKWNAKLVGHLKSDDFFAVETYQEATIVAKKFTKVKGNEYKVDGELTVKGKTNPISFTGTVMQKAGKPTGIKADLEFNRAKFDVKYGSVHFSKVLEIN